MAKFQHRTRRSAALFSNIKKQGGVLSSFLLNKCLHFPLFLRMFLYVRNCMYAHTSTQANKQTNKQTHKQTNKLTNKQTNKTNKQADLGNCSYYAAAHYQQAVKVKIVCLSVCLFLSLLVCVRLELPMMPKLQNSKQNCISLCFCL